MLNPTFPPQALERPWPSGKGGLGAGAEAWVGQEKFWGPDNGHRFPELLSRIKMFFQAFG